MFYTLMFIVIVFYKHFRNVTLVQIFLELFGQEHKFETRFENFLRYVFHKVILKSFLNK
jgi:hypothetical protein